MASVQATNSTATTAASATATATQKKVEDPQDRFLKLLVAQVKNQDPLKPMDNAEMTSQMAQISTVTGIEKLNTTLAQLVSNAGESRSVEAAGLIGHQAFVPGSLISWNGDSAIAGIELAQPVDELKITIVDKNGIPVRQIVDLDGKPAGTSTITWDGKADTGALVEMGDYTFTATATQGGKEVKVETLSLAKVKSVMPGEENTLLDMGGVLGLVDFADVKQVF